MGFEPKRFLDELDEKLPRLKKFDSDFYNTLVDQEKAVFKDGALSGKTKELIAIALSIATKCPYCIPYHTQKAIEKGATKEEMLEAAQVAIAMGGLPATTYTTMLIKAMDELM
ncbi:MAG: carboxymuconolactone decarboxylase family protein [Calditrichia bacterium]